GCRVDSPNHSYSYSFAPNDWPQYFSSQAVLRDYFDRCATEYGIRDAIHFNTEVVSAEFDETSKIWRLHLNSRDAGPRTLEFNAIISAVGQLNRPKFPDIEGRDRFKGIAFHSAQWQHQHDLRGKRIAVIGTGASAFQFVPEIARTASEVLIFQRTPPWLSPRDNYHDHIPEGKHWLLNNLPFYTKWFRFLMFWQTSEGLLKAVKCDPDWHGHPNSVSAEHDQLRQMLTHYLTQMVGDDPALLAKVIPDYPPAGKRMCVDNGTWIRALKRDNVQLFTDGIGEITETGLTTRDGQHHAVDVIIYGTGFKASRLLWPMQIIGRGGVELQQQWNDDPHAYLGITVPGYPNLFCLYGPNTNIVVNGSIIFFSECEMRYIMLALQQLLERNQRTIECKQSVHDAYNDWIDAGNQQMAWGSPRVQSWYKNSQGRVTQNWPYTLLEFWRRTRTLNPDDYQFG
ncbi:MAG TPA: NAD(P)/FAD-dependent oxidoreductase, partial [Pseudomonadales bacterium]|nr:NAD(P)/FAD-dependent oxidoreductase [Pseudomonadales bacterium]